MSYRMESFSSLQKWSEVDWWVLAGLAVGWTPAKTKEFQLSNTDKQMVKVLAQESEQAAPAKFAKVVQAGVGQARVDADGDAHMIISNDLMARTFECCFCKKFYPADSDSWSRYWLSFFKKQLKDVKLPVGEKPECKECAKKR